MEFAEVVRRRRMIRAYQPDRDISVRTVQNLLDLATRAPSAGHTQGREFLVLHDIRSRQRFWAVTAAGGEPDPWLERMRTAPVLVVCLSDRDAYLDRYAEPDKGWTDRDESRWPVPYWDVDTGMAALLILLAAQDVGLGACFFGVPGERWDDLRAEFAIPSRLRPVGVISLGHPAPDRRSPSLRRGRRRAHDVMHLERYGCSSEESADAEAITGAGSGG
jgi:nitroreductase